MEGSGSSEALNSLDCTHTITDNIWRAYAGSWYCPRTITNAASDVSTGMKSNMAGFSETSGTRSHSTSHAQRGARFFPDGDCEACLTCKLLPLHIVSLANYHIEIGFWWRHGDGSCVTGGIHSQIGIFDVVSWVKAICVPILLHVSCSGFQWPNCVTGLFVSVCARVVWPCESSRLQTKLLDNQQTVYGVACYCWMIK